MANSYITVDEFASMLGTTTTANLIVEFAEECIETASRDIDGYCGRRFYKEVVAPAAATARQFLATSTTQVFIDDCYEAPTAVAIDAAADGLYSTSWVAANYILGRAPIDAVAPDDRPYATILAAPGYGFPCIARYTNVQVTARWGWAAVPSGVKSACRRLAHLQYEARNAPFGAAGTPDTGYIRIRDDKLACQLLDPYVRKKLLVA